MQPKKPEFLDEKELRRAIIDLLSRRDYSRLELFRKLKKRCDSAELLEQILDDFQQRNWQSDQRFAESFLNSRYQRGLGPIRLKQEMREKGLASDVIQLTLESSEVDWFQLAFEVAQKKANSLKESDPNKKQKLFRFLAYRGFSSDQIAYAMDEM
ncbi:MAG: recombination regulator RecX [Saccharospirillaceae bacterium]|nr:hypothetical protein A3759_11030 [Thalassolituus sp. HI0120]MCH2040983.1 recombination regulator RecX [Saccharospirillaceae bacterium]